jgi:hypothetical protein
MSDKKTIGQQLKLEINELSNRLQLMEEKVTYQEELLANLKKVVFSLLLQSGVDDKSENESGNESEQDDLNDTINDVD